MARGTGIYIMILGLIFSQFVIATSSAYAYESPGTLITCTNLDSKEQRVLKNRETCRSGELLAKWTRVNATSAKTPAEPSTLVLVGCVSKSAEFSYLVFNRKCASHQKSVSWGRSITVPAEPTINGAAGLDSNSIQLTLNADSKTLDAPIGYYKVRNIQDGTTSILKSNALGRIRIENLASSTTYTFVVTAINADGYSAQSLPSSPTSTMAAEKVIETKVLSLQSSLNLTSANSLNYGSTLSLSSSGGSGSGATVYSVVAGTCSIASTTLTVGNAGSLCQIKATKSGDASYSVTNSPTQTITINKLSLSCMIMVSGCGGYSNDIFERVFYYPTDGIWGTNRIEYIDTYDPQGNLFNLGTWSYIRDPAGESTLSMTIASGSVPYGATTFTYLSPGRGDVLGTFTPTDSVNYNIFRNDFHIYIFDQTP